MDRERIYEPQPDYPKGAYVSKESPYNSFFLFHDARNELWPYNGTYDGWWGHDTLPKLDYEDSPQLEQYIMDIGRKWVSPPYNVDGWRLDVRRTLDSVMNTTISSGSDSERKLRMRIRMQLY